MTARGAAGGPPLRCSFEVEPSVLEWVGVTGFERSASPGAVISALLADWGDAPDPGPLPAVAAGGPRCRLYTALPPRAAERLRALAAALGRSQDDVLSPGAPSP